ncbi:hypothetical protein P7C73_g2212, partial [Tremellales sp. Uapishka_1]
MGANGAVQILSLGQRKGTEADEQRERNVNKTYNFLEKLVWDEAFDTRFYTDPFHSSALVSSWNRKGRVRQGSAKSYDRSLIDPNCILNASVVPTATGHVFVISEAPGPDNFDAWFRAMHSRKVDSHPCVQESMRTSSLPESRHAVVVQLDQSAASGKYRQDPYLPEELKDLDTTLTVCTLSDGDDGEDMVIHHYLFDRFPNHAAISVEDRDKLRNLSLLVGQQKSRLQAEEWVHCWAGEDRSPTWAVLSSLVRPRLSQSDIPLASSTIAKKVPDSLKGDPIFMTTYNVRRYRQGRLVGWEQYEMLCDMLNSYPSPGDDVPTNSERGVTIGSGGVNWDEGGTNA